MPGLRERKKAETRDRIASAARQLFLEHGYDAVTVTAVADAADVSPATVFNYFRTKEELFFSGLDSFERRLVEAVRHRPPGESVFRAFRDLVITSTDALAARGAAQRIARAAQVIASSRALQDEERAVRARYAAALADLLADETNTSEPDVEMVGVATALMGLHGAVVDRARRLAARGISGNRLAGAVRQQATQAFDRLGDGLRHYGTRPATADRS